MECGCYRIGIKLPVICKSQNEVISLTLLDLKEEKGGKRLKTQYSLEDLKDLESKLVLITGTNAEKKEIVKLFINVSNHKSGKCHVAHF